MAFEVGDRIIVENSSAWQFNGIRGVVTKVRTKNRFVEVLLDTEETIRIFLEKSISFDDTDYTHGGELLNTWLNQR